jgi:hypothetical protein
MPFPLPASPRRTRWPALLLALLAALLAAPAPACTLTTTVTTQAGTFSPAAVRQGAVPALQSRAGLECTPSTLVLLSGNYIRARFISQNALKLLRSGGGGTIGYVASADPGGTVVFGQGSTVDYMQNNLLNLLGLLGGSSATLPFFVKPGATLPPVGTYTDRITIDWNWYLCPGGISLAGLCVGVADGGTGRSTIDVTLVVSRQDVTMTTTSTTTWDPVVGTSFPKALPGSRRRVAVGVTNPDIVPLDAGSLVVAVPTPEGALVALDGDGATSGAAIRLADGQPSAGVTIRYTGPADAGDDVDFSADGGATWTYAPVAGNLASEKAITNVRIRPQGTLARQSGFSVWLPYLVR